MNMSQNLCQLMMRCVDKTGRFLTGQFLRLASDEIKKELSDANLSPLEAFHLHEMGLKDIPTCPVCKTPLKQFWIHKFCSQKCSAVSDSTKKKRAKTTIEKYGCENVSMLSSVKEKKQKTCLENHGVLWPMQSDVVKEKSRQTLIESHGVDVPAKSEVVRERMRKTCLERYGTEHPQSLDSLKKKIVQTNMSRYGVSCGLQNKEVQEARKRTCIERLGVPWPTQSDVVKDKVKSSFRKKFADKFMESLAEQNLVPLFEKEDFINVSELTFRCSLCGHVFQMKDVHFNMIHCPECYRNTRAITEGKFSSEIARFYSGEIIRNTRKIIPPYELDIFIPEYNLAIEFNGIYWHSEEIRGKDYHKHKTDLCEEKGIRLIHIFEHEWKGRPDACLSLIRSALGIYGQEIDVSDCEFVKLSFSEYFDFLQENDLSFIKKSSEMFGLKCSDEIVAVVGFRKSKMECYCVKNDTKIDFLGVDAIRKMGKSKVSFLMDRSKHHVSEFPAFRISKRIEPKKMIEFVSGEELPLYDCGWMKLDIGA